ncbi:MAG: hypothetical protein QW165_03375 [Candidatus Woesearchaeota archaeon]
MAIENLIDKFFEKSKRAVVEKPSFAESEVSESQDGVRINLSPLLSTQLAMPFQLIKPPAIVTVSDVSDAAQKLSNTPFSVLHNLDGFYVGGMTKAECTCGKEPVWIHCSALSKEPGREKNTILSELKLSSKPADHLKSAPGIRFYNGAVFEFTQLTGNRYLARVTKPADPPAYKYPNRSYEVSALLTPDESEKSARRLLEHMGKPGKIQQGLITYDDPVKGISPGIIFRRIPVGNLIYTTLTGFYVQLNGTKDRDLARALTAAVFTK